MDEPEVTIGTPSKRGEEPRAICSLCPNWCEGVTNETDFEDVKYWHIKWHEDGMPE